MLPGPLLLGAALVAFDAATHTATVRETESLGVTRSGVAVSRAIAAAEMVVGRRLVVAQVAAGPPGGELVIGVY